MTFEGERFKSESILDIKTHYKPTETFQYTHFTSCHPPGVKRGFIKGEAIRLLRTNSSKTATFKECLSNFKLRLKARVYPKTIIERSLSGVNFALRQSALKQKKNTHDKILPFVTTYHVRPEKRQIPQRRAWASKNLRAPMRHKRNPTRGVSVGLSFIIYLYCIYTVFINNSNAEFTKMPLPRK